MIVLRWQSPGAREQSLAFTKHAWAIRAALLICRVSGRRQMDWTVRPAF